MREAFLQWRRQGDLWTWLTAGAVAISALMVVGLVTLIAVRGLGHFWPAPVERIGFEDRDGTPRVVLGRIVDTETIPIGRWLDAGLPVAPGQRPEAASVTRLLVQRGNRDVAPPDFLWVTEHLITERSKPDDVVMVERSEWGDAIGLYHALRDGTADSASEAIRDLDEDGDAAALVLERLDGSRFTIPRTQIVRAWLPNDMTLPQRLAFYVEGVWAFLSGSPREANTEGGVFPAIFGTVLMVILMTVIVTPMGVVAALYLREYARDTLLTRIVRISVNNLAGVPSIVYGVFGLGFFVYFVGGGLDALLYDERLPTPTFGTPGLLWAALTLALLTVPVVIISTEEGLTRVPRELREGSLALGATRAETLLRVVLPMATPSILTGIMLAVARAAGEVAPLMLVGVVKLTPQLPVDGEFPYLHLERKFMHLGFHIYDVGFQSPNVEAARPLVYATALLLVVIVVLLNLAAVLLRNRMSRRYRALDL